MYNLTEEGKRYAAEGLPEKRLLACLDKPKRIAELKAMKDFNIALQWAKKNSWIEVKSGMVFLKKRPGKIPEQEALKAVSRGAVVGKGMLNILIKRRLVEIEREDFRKKAEKQLSKGMSVLTPELIKTGLWKKAKFRPYNVSAAGSRVYPGKRHPYNAFLSAVRRRLVELGFREMSGPSIETEFWNFDALFQAQGHPARDWTQTYSLKCPKHGTLPSKKMVSQVKAAHENGGGTGSTGWGYRWNPEKAANLMPRAHGTALSARALACSPEIPGKYFALTRCFRPDVIDATHGVEFNHCEGIVIDESLNFKHLLGILKMFAEEFAGAEKVKFLPDYYPFTESSVQLSAKHPKLGWIELGGAGIFREELTLPLGVKEPVIAWGLGIDRLAMFRLGVNDIRELFSRNLSWLRNSRVVV